MAGLWKILKGEIEEPTRYKPSHEKEFAVSVGERPENGELKSLDERIKQISEREKVVEPAAEKETEKPAFREMQIGAIIGFVVIIIIVFTLFFSNQGFLGFILLIVFVSLFKKKKKAKIVWKRL